MNHHLHPKGSGHTSERGTIISYIIGFALSLILTFVTYYLVDKQSVSGQTLMVTILGFGVLQMLVQIFFFLHLGRGPKPLYNVVFFGATVGIIMVVVGGSIIIVNNLHYNSLAPDQVKKVVDDEAIYQINGHETGACHGQYANHHVSIKYGIITPLHTQAKKCDTLTFLNEDTVSREITFGTHPEHKAYAGDSYVPVRKGLSKTITLSEAGSFKFHDHQQAEVAGDFTVVP
ncbi:MAG: cytochrome C oxidase subunit IV family protein [Patescibacteria group bacterium]|nr:cytochrome C oxidase subunit IV family protein [Patescibacteria group bacterium]